MLRRCDEISSQRLISTENQDRFLSSTQGEFSVPQFHSESLFHQKVTNTLQCNTVLNRMECADGTTTLIFVLLVIKSDLNAPYVQYIANTMHKRGF